MDVSLNKSLFYDLGCIFSAVVYNDSTVKLALEASGHAFGVSRASIIWVPLLLLKSKNKIDYAAVIKKTETLESGKWAFLMLVPAGHSSYNQAIRSGLHGKGIPHYENLCISGRRYNASRGQNEHGRIYEVKVIKQKKLNSFTVRYTVLVSGREVNLFHEIDTNRWFAHRGAG